ncbi:peptidylprolyl isomerase, partial [Basilea psittacipulmonis]
ATAADSVQIPEPKPSDSIVTINGKNVLSVADLRTMIQNVVSRGATYSPELEYSLVNGFVNNDVLYQAALKQGLDKISSNREAIAQAQEQAKQNVLITIFYNDWVQRNTPTDSELRNEYNNEVAILKKMNEYQLRNIVYADEASAKKAINLLRRKRTTFEKEALSSLDRSAAADGGLVTWRPADQYIPVIREAIEKAKAGELILHPIKTDLGWHVVRIDGIRPVSILDFNQAKPSLTAKILAKKWDAYLSSLRQAQKISFPVYEERQKALERK